LRKPAQFQIGEGPAQSRRLKVSKKRDYNREMIRVKFCQDRPGKRGKKMSRCKRNIRQRGRSVAKREAGRRVTVQDAENTRLKDGCKEISLWIAGVTKRKPARMMGVEIPQDQSVIGWEVKQGGKFRMMAGKTRRDWWKIYIQNV
jgi:hypothetical protein